MNNVYVLWTVIGIVTLAFAWMAGGLLSLLNWPCARLGSLAHTMLKFKAGDEKDIWLFVLLIGLTRLFILALATIVFATALITTLLPSVSLVGELVPFFLNLFLILLVMRLLSIFLAALLLGGSVRNVLSTLKS
jgi:hypothetical protein